MLDLYYSTEAPLTDDMSRLCKRIRVDLEKHGAIVRELLNEFFKHTPEGYRHRRCDIEIGKAQEKRMKAAESAGKRWHKDTDADAMRTHSEGTANAMPMNSKSHAPNPNPNPNPNPKEKTTRRKASLSVPVDWKPKEETVMRACGEFGLAKPQVLQYITAFQDICQAKGYTYANIDSAFINCIRKDWPGLRSAKPVQESTSAAAKLKFAHEEKPPEVERANPDFVRKLLSGVARPMP